jgi:hypothetical protein
MLTTKRRIWKLSQAILELHFGYTPSSCISKSESINNNLLKYIKRIQETSSDANELISVFLNNWKIVSSLRMETDYKAGD